MKHILILIYYTLLVFLSPIILSGILYYFFKVFFIEGILTGERILKKLEDFY